MSDKSIWSALVRNSYQPFDAPKVRVIEFGHEVDYNAAEERFEEEADARDEIVIWLEPGRRDYDDMAENYNNAYAD